MKKKYTAFYPTIPFWAGETAKERKTPEDNILLLPEIVFIYETDSYSLAICQDGLIMLHVANLEDRVNTVRDKDDKMADIQWSAWGEYFDYLNTLYLIFHTITIELKDVRVCSPMALSFSDVFRFTVTDGQVESFELYQTTIVHARSALLSKYEEPSILPKEIFDQLNESFQKASSDITLVKRLSQIAKAYHEFQDGNFSHGLLLAWLIIESIVMEKWNNLLSDKNTTFPDDRKRINSDRKKLLKGRDYPISVVTNMLELHDYLTFEEFSNINTIRKNRNAVVHQDPAYICSSEHSEEAIVLAWKFATEGKGIEAREFLGYMLPFL